MFDQLRDCARAVARVSLLFAVATLAAAPPSPAWADQPAGSGQSGYASVPWIGGPNRGALGDVAEIRIPAGYDFTGSSGTQQLMSLMQNPTSGRELGLIKPKDKDWFVLFEFQPIGYVKDDEKDELDAAAMLSSIQEGNESANEERREKGWSTIEIVGWEHPPRYDPSSNNLEWALRARNSDGTDIINYNTRLLGRDGVMEVALVCGPQELASTLPLFRDLLAGYGFTSGHKYAEWVSGDKVAEYGLAALVTGSAVAVAAKAGLFAKLGKGLFKLLAIAGVAVAGLAKKIFGKGGKA